MGAADKLVFYTYWEKNKYDFVSTCIIIVIIITFYARSRRILEIEPLHYIMYYNKIYVRRTYCTARVNVLCPYYTHDRHDNNNNSFEPDM